MQLKFSFFRSCHLAPFAISKSQTKHFFTDRHFRVDPLFRAIDYQSTTDFFDKAIGNILSKFEQQFQIISSVGSMPMWIACNAGLSQNSKPKIRPRISETPITLRTMLLDKTASLKQGIK